MTAQVSDTVMIDGHEHDLVAYDGPAPFEPQAHGLVPGWISTACWHGWYVTFAVRERRLHLHTLHVGLEGGREVSPPLLFATRAVWDDRADSWRYDPPDAPLAFTGGILAGRDFLRQYYVHMGFHPAWKYETVTELLFEGGRLVALHDRSEGIAAVREEMVRQGYEPQFGADPAELMAWVQGRFERVYWRPRDWRALLAARGDLLDPDRRRGQ